MFRPSRTRIQMIVMLILVVSAFPLLTAAQVATPVSEPLPTTETPADAPEDVPGSETPDPATIDPSSQPITTQQEEELAAITFGVLECENNDRAGSVDFFPIGVGIAAAASNTSDDCVPLSEDSYVEMYLIDPETENFQLVEGPVMEVEAGTYVIAAWINDSSGESVPIEFPANTDTFVQVVSYTSDTPGGEPEEGTGSVELMALECVNWNRAGEMDFFISTMMSARSATTECTPADASAYSFTLVNADDPSVSTSPSASNGAVVFPEVGSGTWSVTESTSGISSEPFIVSGGQTVSVQAVIYVEGEIDLTVEKIVCEDDSRAGTTEFLIESSSMFSTMATGSTCYSVPVTDPVTVTLDNTDTGDAYELDLVEGFGYLESITAGTYIATETSGDTTTASEAFTVAAPGGVLRIINYVAEDTAQPDPGEGFGILSGMIRYCSSPDRSEGDVDFIIRHESFAMAASTSECSFGGGASFGMLTLYPVDDDRDEMDEAGATPIWTDGMSFSQDIIPSGTYVLGYTSPYTGETVTSEPFTIAHRVETIIDINVYSDPAYTTYLDVWMDICVDPARAGQSEFQLITEISLASVEGAPIDCRAANPDDGEITYVLTNLDTDQTWSRTVEGGDYISFDNLLAGTYTLAETHNGVTQTSDAFEMEAAIDIWHWMNIRSFIAEKDWTEPEPGEDVAYIGIFAYSCANPNNNGDVEWFRYAPVQNDGDVLAAMATNGIAPGTAADTSDCVTVGELDGVGFIAEPADGSGEVYEFFESGPGLFELWDIYGIPAGDYIITELSTGATTGVVRIVGWTAFDVLMFEELPTSDITLNIDSANPSVANTIPAGSTWSITNVDYPTWTLSGAFEGNDLSLPLAITLDEPLPHGEYLIEIDASPAFEPYSETFTIGPMELASTQLFGMLQQLPGEVTLDIVLQPLQQVTPIPTDPVTPEPTAPVTPEPTEPVTPTPTDPAAPEETPATEEDPAADVTQLPNTGGGRNDGREGFFVMIAAGGAIITAAGAIGLRDKRA